MLLLISTLFLLIQCFHSLGVRNFKKIKSRNGYEIISQSFSDSDESGVKTYTRVKDTDHDHDDNNDDDKDDENDENDDIPIQRTTLRTRTTPKSLRTTKAKIYSNKEQNLKKSKLQFGSKLKPNVVKQDDDLDHLMNDFKSDFNKKKNVGFKPIAMTSISSKPKTKPKVQSLTTSTTTKPKDKTRTTIRSKTLSEYLKNKKLSSKTSTTSIKRIKITSKTTKKLPKTTIPPKKTKNLPKTKIPPKKTKDFESEFEDDFDFKR